MHTTTLQWNPTQDAVSATSKCGRARLVRVGAHYRNEWAVFVDGRTHGPAIDGLRAAKSKAQDLAERLTSPTPPHTQGPRP
jgi:hypothetical protein